MSEEQDAKDLSDFVDQSLTNPAEHERMSSLFKEHIPNFNILPQYQRAFVTGLIKLWGLSRVEGWKAASVLYKKRMADNSAEWKRQFDNVSTANDYACHKNEQLRADGDRFAQQVVTIALRMRIPLPDGEALNADQLTSLLLQIDRNVADMQLRQAQSFQPDHMG